MNNLARRYFMGGGKVIDPTESFIVTVDVGAGDTFTLPLVSNGTYDFVADWGDGITDNITAHNQSEVTHTYTDAGTYDIDMNGVIEGWAFNAIGDSILKIIEVKQWGGENGLKIIGIGAFHGCNNLEITATDILNLSLTTTIQNLFRGCLSITFNPSINNWDVSHITNMSSAFRNCLLFNQPLSNWDVSSCTNMVEMFFGVSGKADFNQDISSWNVSNVTNMSYMFRETKFNQDISSWNVSNVLQMDAMFAGSLFNNNCNWTTRNPACSLNSMFANSSFNQPLNNWDVSSVTNFDNLFNEASDFNGDVTNWDVSSATSLNRTFRLTSFNQDISSWDVSNVQTFELTFLGTPFNQNISGWNTGSATSFYRMFRACLFNQDISSWNTANVIDMESMFGDISGYPKTVFNQDISSWNVTSLTNAFDMFGDNTMSTANYDALLVGWESQLVLDEVVFSGGNSQYTIGTAAESARVNLINDHSWTITDGGGVLGADVTTFETESTSESQTFEVSLFSDGNYNFEVHWGDGTSNVITAYNDPNLIHTYSNIGNYNVGLSGVIDGIKIEAQAFYLGTASLKYIKQWGSAQNWAGFTNCRGLLEDLSIDIPVSFRNNSMEDFFYLCQSFIGSSNINNWNVSGVTNFSQCFRDSAFNSNIENWDVSSATDLSIMFYSTPFNQPVNNWNVSNCLNFRAIFGLTSQFNQPLDLWTFNATNFVSLSTMFDRANSFNNNSILSWDMSRVDNVEFMFRGNTSFNQPIGVWDMSNVALAQGMFEDNTGFNQDLSAWNMSSVTSIRSMFRNSNFNSDINGWNLALCEDFYTLFFRSPFNQPLDLWQIGGSVLGTISMFSMFRECPFNQNISGWDISKVSTLEGMFQDNIVFNQPIGTWNVSSVTVFSTMFKNATAFNQDISTWNVSNGRKFGGGALNSDGGMFEGATSFNQDISGWTINNTFGVDFIKMFKEATSFNQNLGSWNISLLQNASEMFSGIALSTTNYDALLTGWEAQKPNILNDVSFDAGNSQYTLGGAAETARNNLTDPAQYNWTITDGGEI